jgi:hypothetical protein
MPLLARTWTVSCPACEIVVGAIEEGRFVHDPACTRPLAIGAGLLRCCQCGGRLAGQEHRAVEVIVEDPPMPSILHFLRPPAQGEDMRQRL